MQITFRTASLSDLQEINQLVQDAIDTMNNLQIFQWDERYPDQEILQEDIEKEELYVGLVDGHIAVIYVLNREADLEYDDAKWRFENRPFYVLHRLCVAPSYQKCGIARKTVLHIEEELRSKGIEAIRLDVFSKNPYALRLYDHLGFTKVGHADWRKGRFYLMEKYI
ncbi:MAG: GNAT family N-acetyltransferase [bacterium]|nr:GNAT family N-acetyltransferase [bacterium]